jgi:hypothetical protein
MSSGRSTSAASTSTPAAHRRAWRWGLEYRQNHRLDALHRGEAYFGRSKNKKRFAPHNLFTSSADLAKAADKLKIAEFNQPEGGFMFKPDAPEAERPQPSRWATSSSLA